MVKAEIDDPPPHTSGRSGGSRGCSIELTNSSSTLPALILLAPTQAEFKTVSLQPKFAWFVRDSRSWPLEFRLYKYDSALDEAELIAEVDNIKSSSGIILLSLFDSIPPLSVGEKYLWQVEQVCDPNRPSGNPYAEVEMEVIATPAELNVALEGVQEQSQRAILYQRKKLFYDALLLVLTTEPTLEVSELKRSLLEIVALDETELLELQNSSVHRVKQ
ncbi:MAG: DUF928 domain-containing protein [Xenococcaceae cyanobacterium MO_207.B15]|nr:DUF928 domain-containing protein [Xenococcaceae cyanobacterium MO_207.B15]